MGEQVPSRRGIWGGLLFGGAVAVLGVLVGTGVIQAGKQPTAGSGSTAEKPKSEADLARTTLSDAHYASLHIKSEPAKTVPVQQHLTLNGWIIAPPGKESVLAAPVSGYVRLPGQNGSFPAPIQKVTQGQELCVLEAVPTPVERAQLNAQLVQMQSLRRSIESELVKARDSLTLAQSEQKSVAELVASRIRGKQDLEQAETKVKHAKADLDAAQDKLRLFDASFGNIEKDLLRPQTLTASQAGTVLAVHVSPGQFVAAGTPLVTIADLSQPWLRVPVAEQDLQRIRASEKIEIQLAPGGPRWQASPEGLVPLVDPVRHTADLLYRLDLPAGNTKEEGKRPPPVLAKDLMVTVLIPLGEKRPETVVPASALVHDAFGGTWLYLELSPGKGHHVFERRRIELGPTVPEGRVIRPGLTAKDKLVVKGAANIYSREFHKPPAGAAAAPPVVDDDD
jgi:multidrug efflux pump subunit AcrA (membrane-fusion protein)